MEKLTEDNMLIAEFLSRNNDSELILYANTEFHDEWNKLMPVAKEVYSACMQLDWESFEYVSFQFRNALCSMDKKAIFDEVINSIIWYNERTK